MLENNADPGDTLRRRKGPIWHKGYYLGGNSVLHITPEKGAHISSVEEFSAGKEVIAEPQPRASQYITMTRAFEELRGQRPYNYWSNNCEHMLNRILYGKNQSETLVVIVSAMLTTFIVVYSRS